MKFGKSLSSQIEETLPEWRDKFLSYKDLKKRLKLISLAGNNRSEPPRKRVRWSNADRGDASDDRPVANASPSPASGSITREEEDFLRLLEAELDKFNSFFIEKEEEYIIHQKELQDRVRSAVAKGSKEELMKVRKEIVDFHGELVLLENYSSLNYTGLVKILKKYDKRTGALLRLPFIQKVLQQPFFTTDLLNKLVKECEVMLDHLFPKKQQTTSDEDCRKDNDEKSLEPGSPLVGRGVPEVVDIDYMESLYMKSTVAALRSLKEIRSGSSTVSVFSLPPLQSNGSDERWNNVPAVEQEAK